MTRSAPLPDSQLPASLPLNIQQQQAARHSAAPGGLQPQSSDPLVMASMHQVSAIECCRAAAHWRWCAGLAPWGAHLLLIKMHTCRAVHLLGHSVVGAQPECQS